MHYCYLGHLGNGNFNKKYVLFTTIIKAWSCNNVYYLPGMIEDISLKQIKSKFYSANSFVTIILLSTIDICDDNIFYLK